MRSFMFIGDPKDQIDHWLEGEHKVLVIAPSEDHDSTARALTTLKTAGLEHAIVHTIILDQEYLFGEGKIDEYLKSSTDQGHYPYIFINKEFVGDHRTIAYMDYQGTLLNTVGLLFLVAGSATTSTRHTSGDLPGPSGDPPQEGELEGETATDQLFKDRQPIESIPPFAGSPDGSKHSLEASPVRSKTSPARSNTSPARSKTSPARSKASPARSKASPARSDASLVLPLPESEAPVSLKEELASAGAGSDYKSAIPPTPDTPESTGCFNWGSKSRASSRRSEQRCKECKRKLPKPTSDIQTQTNTATPNPTSPSIQDPMVTDYIS